MLRIVTVFAATVALLSADPVPHNIFEIDISPEEAQKYLNSPPFTAPQLSGRTAVLPLVRHDSPNFRAAEAGPTLGHYWRNGHEIENTDDYVEEVYNAAQFHGQDGLGAYAYGYQAPESSKVENRERSGDVTGSYTYRSGSNNDLIKVRYWADSEGFHQEDNLPKVTLKPVEEAEDVRQARLAHEKAWQEAAAAAAQQPDPQGEYNPAKYEQPSAPYQHGSFSSGPQQQGYPAGAVRQQGHYAAASENQEVRAPAPVRASNDQGPAASEQQTAVLPPQREGKAYSSAQAGFQQFGKYGQQGGQVNQYSQQQYQSNQLGQGAGQKYEEPEPTGPPRGFFYSFDYPVSILVRKDGQNEPVNPGLPLDHDTVQHG